MYEFQISPRTHFNDQYVYVRVTCTGLHPKVPAVTCDLCFLRSAIRNRKLPPADSDIEGTAKTLLEHYTYVLNTRTVPVMDMRTRDWYWRKIEHEPEPMEELEEDNDDGPPRP